MTYEIATRDYDRTPEGNIPHYTEEEFNSDLEAICHEYTYGDTDGMTEREIQAYLVGEGSGNEDGSPVTIEQISDWINRSIDPSDAFTFYVKNLDTDKMVYENDYCDINDWIESLEGDSDSFKVSVVSCCEEAIGIGLSLIVADELVNLKHSMWGTDGTLDEFIEEEAGNFEDGYLNFCSYLVYNGGRIDDALDCTGIYEKEDFDELERSFKTADPNFNISIIRDAFEKFLED